MKNVTYVCWALLMGIGFFAFVGCSDDDNYYKVNSYLTHVVTVVPLQDGTYYLINDDGNKLVPLQGGVNFIAKENQRALIYYNILSMEAGEYTYGIQLYGIQNILTGQIIDLTEDNVDAIGNDPIEIESVWTGDDFLNFRFFYQTGENPSHLVSLVNNTIDNMNTGETVYLELRHNAGTTPLSYRGRSLASFDLKPYKQRLNEEGRDSINFVIKTTKSENKITYHIRQNKKYVYDVSSDGVILEDSYK